VIMKNLSSRGLLDRTVDADDKRKRLYSLTAAGKQTLRAAQPLVDKSERLVLHGLTKAQVRDLVEQLQRIVAIHNRRLGFCFSA
jgi:DNA-binding MarR family transcriptional regulator